MSYQQKRIIALFFSQLFFLIVYAITALGKLRAGILGPDHLRPWAVFMLIASALGILFLIAVQILFHFGMVFAASVRTRGESEEEVAQELEDAQTQDEMDWLIELKSARAALAVMGFGGIAGLISLCFNAPYALMLNLFFLSGILGMMAESAAAFFYYRNGVRHGK